MATTYLTRTPSSAGSTTKGTFSFWIKKSAIASDMYLWTNYANSTNWSAIGLNNSDQLYFYAESSGSAVANLKTNRLFRDLSAWYHIVVALDSTDGTANDRIKIYVNGVQETSFAQRTNPSSSGDLGISETVPMEIGRYGAGSAYFNGSMANIEFVDGTALTPAYFGSTDSNTGIWTPTATSTISNYGTNGFKLAMDTTTPGADTSGKGNTFTASGTPTLTQGSPSNNWCTWNVLQSQYFWGAAETSFATNGNTTLRSGNSQYGFISGTMGISKGKFYWETKIISETGGSQFVIGIASTMPRSATNHLGGNQYDYGIYSQNGNLYTSNASSSFTASYTTGDIISVAIDYDNAKLYFAKNGAWATGSGAWGSSTFNSATGAQTITTPPPQPTATDGVGTGFYFPAWSYWDGSNYGVISSNFGEGFFGTTAAGTNADGNGQGLFAYAVPSGYYALNTKNLEAYG